MVVVAVSAMTYLILYPSLAATPIAALTPSTDVAASEAPGPVASVSKPNVYVVDFAPARPVPVVEVATPCRCCTRPR